MPKYNAVSNIPAKLFFDVLSEKDFKLLEPFENESEEEVEQVFVGIYDEYFLKSENPKSKEFLRLRQEIAFMTYKIESIVQVIDFLLFNTTTKEMRITLLESLISIGVNINLENTFYDEVQNVLQVELGVITNDLNFAKMDLKEITKDNKDKVFDFYESLVGLEMVHERTLSDEMILSKYIVYERLAIQKSEMQRKNNKKFNT
ncbi:hypothetical protein [Flavobacterium sp.]|uniref:hypothetical protein n=1 Tax=Flavobacterium sp. TaxID=239 RepID=UPI0038FD1621